MFHTEVSHVTCRCDMDVFQCKAKKGKGKKESLKTKKQCKQGTIVNQETTGNKDTVWTRTHCKQRITGNKGTL